MKIIPLTRGFEAIVDDADYLWLSKYTWHARPHRNTVYAQTNLADGDGFRTCQMHRLIMGEPEGQVDHEDLDGLNNVRSNIRLATPSQNMCNKGIQRNNSSGYKGVGRHAGKWRARIAINGKCIHIGYFETAALAAHAYDVRARDLHGKFARTNGSK